VTAPGAGAGFRVLLPALACAPEKGVEAPGDIPDARDHSPGLRGRVLLADDDPTAGAFMEELLGAWGLDVVRAHDGIEARERLTSGGPFRLALLDRAMPGLSGLEVAAWIRDHASAVPVVLYTGYSEDLPPKALEEAGVRALLRKPVNISELRGVLQAILS
jgi:CheY-like chemotaxis protein